MIKNVAMFCLCFGLSGCLTGGATREIVVDPADALIVIEGFGECASPCVVKLDSKRTVRVARVGYTPQKFDILPGGDPVFVTLSLAAPSTEVDSTSLPELE